LTAIKDHISVFSPQCRPVNLSSRVRWGVYRRLLTPLTSG